MDPKAQRNFFRICLKLLKNELQGRVQWEQRPNKDGLDYEIIEINSDYAYKNLDLEITPFEVDHYPVDPAYGYQIKVLDTVKEKKVVISGDTRKNENLITHAMDADALVHEVFINLEFDEKRMSKKTIFNVRDYHTSPKEIGEIAKAANVKKLILTHFVPPVFDEAFLTKEIRESYMGNVIIGEDLLTIEI